jgi:hypothetical protein
VTTGRYVRISRVGWAPRRWHRLTASVAAGGPPWALAAIVLAYSIGGAR